MKRLAYYCCSYTIFSIVVAEETDVFVPEEDEVVIITLSLRINMAIWDEVRSVNEVADVKYYTAKVTEPL